MYPRVLPTRDNWQHAYNRLTDRGLHSAKTRQFQSSPPLRLLMLWIAVETRVSVTLAAPASILKRVWDDHRTVPLVGDPQPQALPDKL